MRHRILIRQARATGDDRALVLCGDGWLLACVTDGAGGSGGGARAADHVIERLSAQFDNGPIPGERDLQRALVKLDAELTTTGGETTATVAVVTKHLVFGVSVGDSEALYSSGSSIERLTAKQQRKPLLGSGYARITGFGSVAAPGARLLLASDGLMKYAPRATVEDLLRGSPLDALTAALVHAAELPNGELPDDVGVVVIELER